MEFPLAPMGVLAPVSAHAWHSAWPSIDTSQKFLANVAAKKPQKPHLGGGGRGVSPKNVHLKS